MINPEEKAERARRRLMREMGITDEPSVASATEEDASGEPEADEPETDEPEADDQEVDAPRVVARGRKRKTSTPTPVSTSNETMRGLCVCLKGCRDSDDVSPGMWSKSNPSMFYVGYGVSRPPVCPCCGGPSRAATSKDAS